VPSFPIPFPRKRLRAKVTDNKSGNHVDWGGDKPPKEINRHRCSKATVEIKQLRDGFPSPSQVPPAWNRRGPGPPYGASSLDTPSSPASLVGDRLCRVKLLHLWGHTMPFRLTPPTQLTLLISVVLAVLAVILHYAHIELPIVGTHTFGLLLLSYLVLLAGNLVDGI
jgi:hypothetical protein